MRSKATALELTAQILAVYCFAVLVLHAWKPQFTNASVPVRGITDPVLALQMARTVDDVDNVLEDSPSADREVMRIKQYIDFALIAGYVALALVVGEYFARRKRSKTAIRLAQLFAVAAGGADIRENVAILHIVNIDLSEVTPALLRQLHVASLTKWLLLAVALLLLAVVAALSARRGKARAIALCAPAMIGSVWTFAGLYQNTWLIWGGVIMIAALLLIAATLKLLTHEPATQNSNPRPVRRTV